MPPPGAGFVAVTWKACAADTCAVVSVALACAASATVVSEGAPSNASVVAPARKPLPVTTIVGGGAPSVTLAGVSEVAVTAGYATVSVTGALTPPPGAGFVTATGNAPTFRRELAGTDAESCVALVNVVASAVPLKETTLAATNPVPTRAIGVTGPSTVRVLGVTVLTVTFGFETTNAIDEEVPPPGVGFVTVTG